MTKLYERVHTSTLTRIHFLPIYTFFFSSFFLFNFVVVAKQIYSLDDAECSEICFCSSNLALTCHALCVPFKPCRTALAFYSHASPAYQAFRGRCLCYSGNFICMRPQHGEYTLPGKQISKYNTSIRYVYTICSRI